MSCARVELGCDREAAVGALGCVERNGKRAHEVAAKSFFHFMLANLLSYIDSRPRWAWTD